MGRMETPNCRACLHSMPHRQTGALEQAGLAGEKLSTPTLSLSSPGCEPPPQSLFLLSQQLDLDLLNWKVDSSGAFSESQC